MDSSLFHELMTANRWLQGGAPGFGTWQWASAPREKKLFREAGFTRL